MRLPVSALMAMALLGVAAWSAAGQEEPDATAETILENHGAQLLLDADGITELVAELGHRAAVNRKAAAAKARQLNYSSLSSLTKILAASDDPELEDTGKSLEPLLRKLACDVRPEAIETIRKAIAGDAYAQGVLANMFRRPECGLPKNPAEALRWAKKSVEQKHPIGMYAMANMYRDGVGVEKDPEKSRELFSRCAADLEELADQGNARAQCNVGWMYRFGTGVATNHAAALEWYGKASEQGYARAHCSLAFMWRGGIGVEKDDEKAVQLFREAAIQGSPRGQFELAWMYSSGRGVETNYAAALKYYTLSAEQGAADSLCNLGWMHENGYGVPRNYPEAVRLYTEAGNLGSHVAQNNLGLIYRYGRGVPRDRLASVKWLQESASGGHAPAQYNLGVAHGNGMGIPRDYAKAAEWYLKAAEQGHHGAQNKLGDILLLGRGGMPKDRAGGLKWLRKAAEGGYADSQWFMGNSHEHGHHGLEKDLAKALEWYTKAADSGQHQSCNSVAWLLATCADPKFHNGRLAVRHALTACSRRRSHAYVDTLAAAYARNGEFQKAVTFQIEALRRLKDESDATQNKDLAGFEKRLELYKQNKTYTQEK